MPARPSRELSKTRLRQFRLPGMSTARLPNLPHRCTGGIPLASALDLLGRAMPELPEVETVVRSLHPFLPGLRIAAVHTGRKRLRRPLPHRALCQLRGRTFQAVRRRGKWIVLELEDMCLLVHLGMTGRLQLVSGNAPRPLHGHVTFSLEPGDLELRFSDPRRFGALVVLPARAANQFLEDQLGPEPFELNLAEFHKRLAGTRRTVKTALMDQRLLAGLGNIYSDEALYQAQIAPHRTANSLTRPECQRLLTAIREVLHRAIECRGSTIRDYIFGENGRGSYQEEFLVYGRAGAPCHRCQHPICRCSLAGRSCYYCPRCQT
ncbi:Formamidopyrimidine-DNA glycosylase [bacterium HR36]|nr:Formamidopyrimidine-DNA glycosylase [bacterium HR36]